MEISTHIQNNATQSQKINRAAQALEAEFVKTMLKESNFGAINDSFHSTDQDQWLSFLHEEMAHSLVAAQPLGIADILKNRLESLNK